MKFCQPLFPANLVCERICMKTQMGVSKNKGTPKSSILIGFSMKYTIHFGGKIPLFLDPDPFIVHFASRQVSVLTSGFWPGET